jgi:hypothetical protein
MKGMFPIAQINSHHVMRRALVGANATDPVLPERSKRQRRRRQPAVRQPQRRCGEPITLRGTS